jgi:DNA-3-methyladenine glycosylase II
MAGTVAKKTGASKRARKAAPRKKAAAPRRRATKKAEPRRYLPGPPIDSQAALDQACARLLAIDPEVAPRLIEVGGPPALRWREPGFAGLAATIVSQQVSVASAEAMLRRVKAELEPLSAATVLAADDAALRRCGLSQAKMRALRALAAATLDGLDLDALGARDAAEAHDALVAVKGIGPWTADLFLLFCLGHPDAFPSGDLALQEATRLAFGLRQRPDPLKLERIAERWRPLRGVAARLLWGYYRGVKKRAGVIGQ